MKHTYHIKMRVSLWVMLGIVCLASAPAMAESSSTPFRQLLQRLDN